MSNLIILLSALPADEECTQHEAGPSTSVSSHTELDIGHAVEKLRSGNQLTDEEKTNYLTKRWFPDKKQDFPFSLCKRSGKKWGSDS